MTLRRTLTTLFIGICSLAIVLTLSTTVIAEQDISEGETMVWTAENSDPNTLGWMQGAPPPADKIIRFDDGSYAQFPQWRWTVCHFQQLMPTKAVSRGVSSVAPLASAEVAGIDDVSFMPLGATEPMTWKQSLAANFTDGILVMHHGRKVYETYSGCLDPTKRHGAMSMTKSFVGLLGAMLVEDGTLDETKLVREYIPELSDSAFGDATVRQVLDMTTGLDYSEDYADPNAGYGNMRRQGIPYRSPRITPDPAPTSSFCKRCKSRENTGSPSATRPSTLTCWAG
jgi:hypothetical protein